MLERSGVAARLPARDLGRARAFYAEKLGLKPIEERRGGLRYRCEEGELALFESAGAASGSHTQMAWEVLGERAAWFKDSEGNLLAIGQPVS